MNLLEAVRTAVAEILEHKLRSALTLVGIVLGTTSLVVMVSVIGGVAAGVRKGLSDLGYDGVLIVTDRAPRERLEQKKQSYSRGLRSGDLGVIRDGRELLEDAAPVVSLSEVALINGRTFRVPVEGITPAYGAMRNRGADTGRFILDRDLETYAPVAVIGQTLKQDAFGSEEALGREILIRGVRFRIVGTIRALGNRQVNDDDMRRDNSKVWIPLTTMQKQFTGSDAVHAYMFKVKDVGQLTNGQTEAEALLRRSHRIGDFRVQNIGEELVRVRKEVDKLVANWTAVLASIAGISLLVGGIGIFSVMQISISERVYEIGLRKSLGATDASILAQFLIESVSLSVLGGALGAGLGSFITLLAGQSFPDGLAISPVGLVLAAAFAVFIGLAAGFYPAVKAARLQPVEAIRGI